MGTEVFSDKSSAGINTLGLGDLFPPSLLSVSPRPQSTPETEYGIPETIPYCNTLVGNQSTQWSGVEIECHFLRLRGVDFWLSNQQSIQDGRQTRQAVYKTANSSAPIGYTPMCSLESSRNSRSRDFDDGNDAFSHQFGAI